MRKNFGLASAVLVAEEKQRPTLVLELLPLALALPLASSPRGPLLVAAAGHRTEWRGSALASRSVAGRRRINGIITPRSDSVWA